MKLFKIMPLILAATFLGACSSDKTPKTPLQTAICPAETALTTVAETSSSEQIRKNLAKEYLDKMSLNEKVGQMFFATCPKNKAENELDYISTYALGGYILFSEDFKEKTPEKVQQSIEGYQNASKIPMLIGVDEEGGKVVRASKYPEFRSEPFPSPQELFEKGGFDLIKTDTAEKIGFLKNLGVNVNLAPVCDVSTNPDDYINNRSFGQNAEQTAEYIKTTVGVYEEYNFACVLKHFPGYGNNIDTHTGIAIDERSYEEISNNDFLPFIAGINSGVGAILVNHNITNCIDETVPSSISPKVHEVLRETLNFDGVIMTDELGMDAIEKYTYGDDVAVLAVIAGNDLIVSTNFTEQYESLMNAVNSGKIDVKRIDESVMRILEWKIKMGIIS
ncbi:MAG: glycoside hydrolase family 3 N-terminal domain-containing protein [Oscillospiraceae bacterium]